MAIAFVANVAAGSTDGNGFTTSAIDTTGADFLVVAVGHTGSGTTAMSDSKSNTWSALTNSGTGPASKLFYVKNATVGAGHTFTVTGTGQVFPAISVAAFSGTHLTAPFDVENGATATSNTTISTGSITPSENNELIIAGVSTNPTTSSMAIDSGFTIPTGGSVDPVSNQHYGAALAYLIQGTAAAVNPAWSWITSQTSAARIATFKAAAAAAAGGWSTSLALMGVGV